MATRMTGGAVPWLYLALAGLFEIVWAYAMKRSLGLTRPDYAIVMVLGMVASFAFLSLAMRSLPLGTAYAVWTGIGAVGAFVVGIVLFGEPVNVVRLAAISLILVGMVMLKLG